MSAAANAACHNRRSWRLAQRIRITVYIHAMKQTYFCKRSRCRKKHFWFRNYRINAVRIVQVTLKSIHRTGNTQFIAQVLTNADDDNHKGYSQISLWVLLITPSFVLLRPAIAQRKDDLDQKKRLLTTLFVGIKNISTLRIPGIFLCKILTDKSSSKACTSPYNHIVFSSHLI